MSWVGAILSDLLRLGSTAFPVDVIQTGQRGADDALSCSDNSLQLPLVLCAAVAVPGGDAACQHRLYRSCIEGFQERLVSGDFL